MQQHAVACRQADRRVEGGEGGSEEQCIGTEHSLPKIVCSGSREARPATLPSAPPSRRMRRRKGRHMFVPMMRGNWPRATEGGVRGAQNESCGLVGTSKQVGPLDAGIK